MTKNRHIYSIEAFSSIYDEVFDDFNVKFTRKWGHGNRYRENYYYGSPASLARVCRVIQGQPAFGEVCEWKVVDEPDGDYYYEPGCDEYRTVRRRRRGEEGRRCPYCGQLIVVVKG